MGSIGRQVARRLRAFEARLVYHDIVRQPVSAERELELAYVSIEEMFRASDVVTIHVPLIAHTRHLVGRELINLMKPTAVIVNTARGAIIDEAALIDALVSGRIAGAGLDVFETEPVQPDNPLLRMPNVIVTPHSAGTNWDAWSRRAAFGYANVARFHRGEGASGLIEL